jgi:hypothetical protein
MKVVKRLLTERRAFKKRKARRFSFAERSDAIGKIQQLLRNLMLLEAGSMTNAEG